MANLKDVKPLSRQEMATVMAALSDSEDVLERLEYFKADFYDGQHQLVAYLKDTPEYPRTGRVVLEGWMDYTEKAESLNAVFGLEVDDE
ncbi:hypothetical protein [Vibrio phage V-YDF132]|nr:hypothetical protein [Vibrio phage V-YDF132]